MEIVEEANTLNYSTPLNLKPPPHLYAFTSPLLKGLATEWEISRLLPCLARRGDRIFKDVHFKMDTFCSQLMVVLQC